MKNSIDSLIDRLKLLPRPEIEQVARSYESRAQGRPNARNNVSARIAISLRLHLEKWSLKMPTGYKSTGKAALRDDLPAWKRRRLATLWTRYREGKITKAEYDQQSAEIKAKVKNA